MEDTILSKIESTIELVKQVLGKDCVKINIDKITLEENLRKGLEETRVTLKLDTGVYIMGEGVGFIDAVFHNLRRYYAKEYDSLNTLELAKLDIGLKLDTKREASGTSAVGEVCITIKNSWGYSFEFSHASRSLAASAAIAVSEAIEFFINSEKAFVTLYTAIKDARERNRQDLLTRYTKELAEIVRITSYTKMVEVIKKDLNI